MFDWIRKHQRLMQGLLLLFIFPAFAFFGISGYDRFLADDGAMKSDHAAVDTIGRFKVRKIDEPNAFPDLRNVSQTF